MCAFTLKWMYAAAWGGEMQEDRLCDPTKLGKLMGVWECGCLIERQRRGKAEMYRWKEERLQNIGLNIKNTRLTAPVDHLLIHGIPVCECAHVSVLPKPSKTGWFNHADHNPLSGSTTFTFSPLSTKKDVKFSLAFFHIILLQSIPAKQQNNHWLSTQLKSDFLIKNRHVPRQRCNSKKKKKLDGPIQLLHKCIALL